MSHGASLAMSCAVKNAIQASSNPAGTGDIGELYTEGY